MSHKQYLTFRVENESFGVPIESVREIIRVGEITKVPGAQDQVEGVMNLRGRIIPVLNLRVRFALPRAEFNRNTCIVILENIHEGQQVGLIIDAVREVLTLTDADHSPAPEFSGQDVVGMGKTQSDVIILLDPMVLIQSMVQLKTEEVTDVAS